MTRDSLSHLWVSVPFSGEKQKAQTKMRQPAFGSVMWTDPAESTRAQKQSPECGGLLLTGHKWPVLLPPAPCLAG